MRYALAALLVLLAASPAGAQTCPATNSTPQFTAGGNVFGRLAAQWNAYFGGKADANNGTLCNPTIIGAPKIASARVIAAAGLSNQNGTRNPGTQEVSAIGGTVHTQLWPVRKTLSYVVNSDLGVPLSDHGAVLIAAGVGVTFTLPNPATATIGVTYQFGSDGTHGFTIGTVGATALIYGCTGGGGATATFAANIDVTVVDDGLNYKCRRGS